MIVCTLIIAVENFVTVPQSSVNFFGLSLNLSQGDIVGGLSIGFVYLWLVAISQFMEGPITKLIDDYKETEIQKINVAFNGPDEERVLLEQDFHDDDPEFQSHKIVHDRISRLNNSIQSYSQSVFLLPLILLSIFVAYKYNAFGQALTTVLKLIF